METTSTTTTTQTRTCAPGHRTGSKPYIVPVLGNREREVHQFVVYHGSCYLDVAGNVVRHPVWMTHQAAESAIRAHESAVSA